MTMTCTITSTSTIRPGSPFDPSTVMLAGVALSTLGIGRSPTLTTPINGNPVTLKLETNLPSGSYKARPAACALLLAQAGGFQRGVGASTGNFAGGLGYSADKLGIGVSIYVPKPTPEFKIHKIQQYRNVDVHVAGDTFDDARAAAEAHAQREGAAVLEPFDSHAAMLGNATIGLELGSLKPDLLVSPIGGGGLAAGTGLGLESMGCSTSLAAVGSANAPAAVESINRGTWTEAPTTGGIAEAVRVAKPGLHTIAQLVRLGATGTVVTDDEIERAMAYLWYRCKVKSEGGGAAAVAALLSGKVVPRGMTVAIVSGSNIDDSRFAAIVSKYKAEFVSRTNA